MSVFPTDSAYNRLDEAHRAWHQALDGYHSIEDFRAGVNAAIQALRNTTFMLQGGKDSLPGFDEWYAEWQQKMKADAILKSFHDARRVVVHSRDLKLMSKATAIVKSWEKIRVLSFEFDPADKTEDVAKQLFQIYIKEMPISDYGKSRLVFELERKWVYEKIPDTELLEALAYAQHFFYKLLLDAHVQFLLPARQSYRTGEYCQSEVTEDGELKCMRITERQRTLSFSAKDGAAYIAQQVPRMPNRAELRAAAKRYGRRWESKRIQSKFDGLVPTDPPFNVITPMMQAALSNMERDKSLVPVSFIFKTATSSPRMIGHSFPDQGRKVLEMDYLAEQVIKDEAEYVLMMAEAWTADVDPKQAHLAISDRKDKRETIDINIITAEKGWSIDIPFSRVMGNIIFSKPKAYEFSTKEHHRYMFNRVIEALKKIRNKKT